MIEIDKNILARVYSFDLQFKGGKRTKFYRKLFGFKSTTKREDEQGHEKVYEHFYPGILTPIPHLRLGKSVIAIPKNAQSEIDDFFQNPEWGDIDLYSFDGVLPSQDRYEAMEDTLASIRVARKNTLAEEIEILLNLESKNNITSEEEPRISKVLEECERLIEYDWTDDSEFSDGLEEKIEPLRNWRS